MNDSRYRAIAATVCAMLMLGFVAYEGVVTTNTRAAVPVVALVMLGLCALCRRFASYKLLQSIVAMITAALSLCFELDPPTVGGAVLLFIGAAYQSDRDSLTHTNQHTTSMR